jgi:hypothetical protein
LARHTFRIVRTTSIAASPFAPAGRSRVAIRLAVVIRL